MCQINTEKMKQQNGCLDVNVPPDIDYLKTSQDVVVQEVVSQSLSVKVTLICLKGENVTLVCSASGHPTPRITWRREDRENIVRKPGRSVIGLKKGENISSPTSNTTIYTRDKKGAEKYEGENLTISK